MAVNYSVKVRFGVAFFAFFLTISSLQNGVVSRPSNSISPGNPLNVASPTNGKTPVVNVTIGSHFTIGKRVDGDRAALQQIYDKPMIAWRKPARLTWVKFPPGKTENKCPITMVDIRCPHIACEMENDKVTIVDGGLGETKLKLKIASTTNVLYPYKVLVFVKC